MSPSCFARSTHGFQTTKSQKRKKCRTSAYRRWQTCVWKVGLSNGHVNSGLNRRMILFGAFARRRYVGYHMRLQSTRVDTEWWCKKHEPQRHRLTIIPINVLIDGHGFSCLNSCCHISDLEIQLYEPLVICMMIRVIAGLTLSTKGSPCRPETVVFGALDTRM